MNSMLPNTVTDNGAVFERCFFYAIAGGMGFLAFTMLNNDPGIIKTFFGYIIGFWALASFIYGFSIKTTYHKGAEWQGAKYNKRRS